MVPDEEGFWYPEVDKDKCIDCGLCEKICPIIHKVVIDESCTTTAMAAINLNEEIRLNSSSGGVFTLISEYILDQGGVVFGAAFTKDFKAVHHICVVDRSELKHLRGSKYLQSEIGDTYKQAKAYLDNGRKVLFTGTPCQIGGLYSFLRKSYDNLFTQDIICHGVPSPMVWKKNVENLESKKKSEIKNVCFRDKQSGWKTFSLTIEFINGAVYSKEHSDDAYMKAFLANCCLRHSCYNCSFKGIKRESDITLADFWGVQNVFPEMDDNMGTSLVLLHSSKGQEIFKNIQKFVRSKYVKEDITKYNSAAITSVKKCSFRSEYMVDIISEAPDKLAKKYFKKTIKQKIASLIRKLRLKRIKKAS